VKVALAKSGSDCSLRATRFLIGLIGERDGWWVHDFNLQPPVRYADFLAARRKPPVKQWYRGGGQTETAAALEGFAEARVARDLHLFIRAPATAIVKLVRRLNFGLLS
jgi:hypothetical protein